MKRLFVLTAFLTVLAGCRSVDSNATDPSAEVFGQESFKPIEFVIKDTSATKSPAPITSLSQFNVTATTGSAGSEASKFSNVVFANRSGVFKSDAVWPAADPKYHFYASNVAMTHTASGQTVTISNIDKDVVCAYLVSPSYKVKNDLVFNHILARVGTVTFTNLSLCSNVNLSMKYSGSGTYNISTGAWSGLGSQSTKELTTADNDLWIIPGSYDATLIYTDANGNPQSKTISQDFLAGKVNNISAKLDGSVVVKTEDKTEWDYRNDEWDDGYWAKINGKTSDSKTVESSSGKFSFTATVGHVHHIQPQKCSRSYKKYTCSNGDVTYGDYGQWSSWTNNGDATVTYPSDNPMLSSDKSWLDKNGSYTENTGTSSRTGKITAAVKVGTTTKASATLTVNQAAATITYKLTCTGSAVSMKVGESKSFSPTVKRQKYVNGKASGIASEFSTGVTFVIGDSSIATITSQTYSSKKVKGESVGSTKIYAKMTIDGVEYNSKDNGDSGISVTVTSNDQYEVEVE